ncbi:MAG: PIG-L family deacetylase [Gemmatimonadota bacterium]
MRSFGTLTVCLCLTALAVPPGAPAQDAAHPRLEYEGAIATGLALRRLGHTGRVLHIGAHPDDENTALFSPLALGRGADVAYLSLTRGEGGQNGIGPELGVALGLIRSEELLSARRLDGAGQFFTRAVDFGFSKTAEETFTHWPRDSLLADIVAVIRRYRPDVVVSVWSGTRRDGHGQHEASGLLSHEAVRAAGDPERFPEQIEAGLRPHAPELYYWSARYGDDGPDVELDTGELDPLLGRSYHQIAMASRSRHRSQDMGVPQTPGPRRTAFDRVDPFDLPEVVMRSERRPNRQLEGASRLAGSLFARVDTLLSQRAERAGVPEATRLLDSYERRVRDIREDVYSPFAPWDAGRRLVVARSLLDSARAALDERSGTVGGTDERAATAEAAVLEELKFHLDAERADLGAAVIAASNVEFDAVSDEELVVPGQTFELELSAWNGHVADILVRMQPELPEGWSAWPTETGEPAPRGRPGIRAEPEMLEVRPGRRLATRWTVHVPGEAEITAPYFLRMDEGTRLDTASDGGSRGSPDLYSWPDDPSVRGLPFGDAAVRGEFVVDFRPHPVRGAGGGPAGEDAPPLPDATFELTRDAAFVGLDARSGEFRRPVRVVPRVSVRLDPKLVVLPVNGDRTLNFGVRLLGEAPDGLTGTLRPAVPDGWAVNPASTEVELPGEGEERTVRFEVIPPAGLDAGEYRIGAIFDAPGCGGETPCVGLEAYAHGYELIDYPHIDPHHLYRPAESRVRVLDVRVADVRVGYVAGVPDGVPEALDQLRVSWEALDERGLAEGDLSRFDVIVTGTRAYEVRPDLVAHNHRLLDWARGGGTLIVQYNKYPALEGSYAPWPVTIDRPHGRVTDETAPVDVLRPDHPIFRSPNPIGPGDWDGWVQERGLYFWESWEGPLEPLVAMNDPGEEPLDGALLAGPLGEGTYVYSALALFRQLPEGVPGAYRLLANLVSLGAR